MFCRISAVFGRHVLHVFYAADSLRLARYATNSESTVASAETPRAYAAGVHVQKVRVVRRVDRRGPPAAVAADVRDAVCVTPSHPS